MKFICPIYIQEKNIENKEKDELVGIKRRDTEDDKKKFDNAIEIWRTSKYCIEREETDNIKMRLESSNLHS